MHHMMRENRFLTKKQHSVAWRLLPLKRFCSAICHIISMEASVLDHALRALSELEVLVFCLLLL